MPGTLCWQFSVTVSRNVSTVTTRLPTILRASSNPLSLTTWLLGCTTWRNLLKVTMITEPISMASFCYAMETLMRAKSLCGPLNGKKANTGSIMHGVRLKSLCALSSSSWRTSTERPWRTTAHHLAATGTTWRTVAQVVFTTNRWGNSSGSWSEQKTARQRTKLSQLCELVKRNLL